MSGAPPPAARIGGFCAVVDVREPEADRGPSLGRALVEAGANVLVLRMKGARDRVFAGVAKQLVEACHGRATFIVNDRIDIALAVGADGVHLGQHDLPMQEAKNLARPGFLIGRTAHTDAEVRAAMQSGADWFAFGPVYAAEPDEEAPAPVGPAALAAVVKWANVPCVAFGGIPLDRLREVAAARPAAIAVSAAVNEAPDLAAAARQVLRAYYDGRR